MPKFPTYKFLVVALSLWASICLYQCQSKTDELDIYEGMDARTKTRMRQYMVQGKGLYQVHCQNCHGEKGEGLGKLIPPLAKADYLMDDIERAICIVKKGQQGEIEVNGILYNQPMPASSQLKELEIAEIITYITNSWGNRSGLWEVKKIETLLSNCNY